VQGRKHLRLGGTTYLCDESTFLLSSIDMPVVNQIMAASEDVCPRPAKASGGVRRPARHGSGSSPSPSRGVAGAQPPTSATTRSGVCSSRDAPSRVPCLSSCLLPSVSSSSFRLSLDMTDIWRLHIHNDGGFERNGSNKCGGIRKPPTPSHSVQETLKLND
jgi:hypothetical protein